MPQPEALAVSPTRAEPSEQTISSFRSTVPGRDLTNKVRPLEDYYFACGASGDIWKGLLDDHNSRRIEKVAVKVLRSVQPGQPITFLRESGLWSAAQHPNITPFLGVSFDFHRRGTPCLVSPFLKEGNIINYIKKHPGANKLALLAQAALGVAYLHTIDIIHGDIKGNNILINDDGEASVIDFGLSRTFHVTGVTTQTGPGTPRFMAPELISLVEDEDEVITRVTKKTDVWAFGMTVIEILTESKPFPRIMTDVNVSVFVARGGRPNRQDCLQIKDEIWVMLKRCWDAEPSRRPEMQAFSTFFASQSNSEARRYAEL